MTHSNHQYFPERYVHNRHFFPKALKQFLTADFDRGNAYHELRFFIRQPVHEWQAGSTLPEELYYEREEILAELHKGDIVLSQDPTKEEMEKFAEQQSAKMKTEAWKKWTEWLAKTKGLVKNYPRLEEETATIRKILSFYKHGRNIFNIVPFLVDLLRNTDVGNIRLQDIKLPYQSLYFHFDPINDIEFPIESLEHKHDIHYRLQDSHKKYFLDGAFVTMENEYSLDIVLTFIDPNDNFDERINIVKDYRFPTVNYTLDFSKWSKETTKHIIDLNTTFDESTICFNDIWDPETNPGEIKYDKLKLAIKNKNECFESEWEEYVIMDKALKLIVNCICYLNSVDKDIEIGATNKEASDILRELEKTKKAQAVNKLKDKLKRFTYSRIHFCGNKLKQQLQTELGGELDPHWRRGHWRNQPFGSGLTQTKLIWIKPTIVRKDKGQPLTGHIYEA